jgi:lipoprotein signal peptidase
VTNNVALVGPSCRLLAASAGLTAAAGLAHTAVAISTAGVPVSAHERPVSYVVGISLATLAWAVAIALTRSAAIAVAGGVLVGGAAANVLSLVLWPSVDGVPDPLVAGSVAFNVADLAVALGLVLVLLSAIAFAVRNRDRLAEPVRF